MGYSPQAILAGYDIVNAQMPSMEESGVAALKKGYHSSYNDNRRRWPGNYSITEPLDQQGDKDAASGLDMKFNPKDMRTVTGRLMDASLAGDPRLYPIREWFGSYDGEIVTGYSLYRKRKATSDPSHRWHIHLSGWRKYANDAQAWLGVFEVICGFKPGTLTKPEPVKYLRVRYVDPAKVDTFLYGIDHFGDRTPKQRPPGFALATVVRIVKVDGVDWALTEAGYRYHTGYLTFTEPAPKDTDPPAGEEPMPTYYVDPAKVSTTLYAVDHATGEPARERPPGYAITNGEEIVTVDGRKWLLTEAGRRYALDYLTTTKPVVPPKGKSR